MINKNKFSIKDTKKVLHKVGKKWVVVSAVLLGLAAGGAAVTTANANAANTQAAQPQTTATTAQQVNKNANMSAANHSFGAADPANVGATEAPTTMKLGADNGMASNLENDVKTRLASHHLPTNKQEAKATAKHYASYANTDNLTKLARYASNEGSTSNYDDLVSIASNVSQFSNGIKIGQDSAANSASNNWFGILNRVTSDFSKLNTQSNSDLSKIVNKLNDIQSLANSSVTYTFHSNIPSNTISSSSNSNVSYSSNISIPTDDIKAMKEVGITIPNNMPVSINSNETVSFSYPMPSMAVSVPIKLDIPQMINSGIPIRPMVYSAVSLAASSASVSLTPSINSSAKVQVDSEVNYDVNSLISSAANSYINHYISNPLEQNIAKGSLASIISGKESSIDQAVDSNINGTNDSNINSLVEQKIKNHLSGTPSSEGLINSETKKVMNTSPIVDVTNILGPKIGPFANDSGSLDTFINDVHYYGGGILGLLNDTNAYNDSVKIQNKLNEVKSIISSLSNKGTSLGSNYNDLLSAVASLPNDFTAPKAESKAYSAYTAIASDAQSLINSASSVATANNLPHASAISDYATPSIVNEAKALANSMHNTSSAMQNDVNGINGDITSIESYEGKVSAKDYNSAMTRATSDSTAANNDLSNYYNSLSDGPTSSADTNEKLADANTISLSASSTKKYGGKGTPVTPSTHHNGGNVPNIPSVPTNNNYVAPASASVSAEPTSATTNNISSIASTKAPVANYVTVSKELQLHTSPNFTKKNGVAVIEPNTRLDLEKTVRANHGLARYEVNYKGKNYFITANKRYTNHMSYTLAKPTHYRYLKVSKALQLHTSPYFTKKNGVIVAKPGAEFRINRVVKAHGLVRYEVNYKGNVYFITANKKFSANAYLQKGNFRKHGYRAIKVVKPLNEYRKLSFAKRSFIRHFYRGSVLPVKKVITIANGEMTRLQLTNGRYVTANKNFVEVIK